MWGSALLTVAQAGCFVGTVSTNPHGLSGRSTISCTGTNSDAKAGPDTHSAGPGVHLTEVERNRMLATLTVKAQSQKELRGHRYRDRPWKKLQEVQDSQEKN